MKNKEKFAREIFNIACRGDNIAVTITNNEIVPCESIECEKCIFEARGHEECSDKIKKWCESEYVDKPKLTITSKEKKFLDLLLPKYNYIARDYNTGKLSLYKYKPFKYRTQSWISQPKDFAYELPYESFDVEFDFIRWTDEEPWSIKDLNKLEVKDE